MRVIVTRPAAEAAEWVDALRARGFDAVAFPLIDIRIAADTAPLRDAWSRVANNRAVMFVSANAVRGFFSMRPVGSGFSPRAWATGAGTRAALAQQGVAMIDSPPADSPQFDSEALWEVVKNQCVRGDRVLIVRGGDAGAGIAGRDWLADQLVANGAQVEQVLAYERAAPAWTIAQEQFASQAALDGSVWLLSSSQAVAHLLRCAPGLQLSSTRAVATHPRIAQAAREAGFGVVCVSRPPMEAVVRALESVG
jgi:uroporphyrinogen-III synthase